MKPFNLYSIRVKIFAAFLSMCGLTMVLGMYAYAGMSKAGAIVVDIYDRPLMAINFARSASLAFLQMNNIVLQKRLTGGTKSGKYRTKLKEWEQTFNDDIAIAEERALTQRSLNVISDIKARVATWEALVKTLVNNLDENTDAWSEIDTVSDGIIGKFDLLIELTAGQSFLERQKAVREIDWIRLAGIAVTCLALVLSLVVTFLLARRIVRPVEAAATSADRIASGELDTDIPVGGRDEIGSLLHSMRFMQSNIQEMMIKEKARSESAQSRLADALSGSGEGMILVDQAGGVIAASPKIEEYFPSVYPLLTTEARFCDVFARVGLPLYRASDEPDSAQCAEQVHPPEVAAALYHGGEFQLHDGRWLQVNRSDTQEGGFFLFVSDITGIKEREEKLVIARELAEAASVAKTNFLANMSHELRTPLNAIIGFAEMLSSEIYGSLGDKRYSEYSKDILASGEHLLSVINRVLDIAKAESNSLDCQASEIALSSVVGNCARMIAPQCNDALLTLEVEDRSEGGTLWADEAKIRQVLINLLSNAVKFTEPGGTIHLRVSPCQADSYTIEVEDSGIGMSPEQIPIALSPFGQVDSSLQRKYEGTGLGLPLTKALIELHKGSMTLSSALGQGTIVTVCLPKNGPIKESREDRSVRWSASG